MSDLDSARLRSLHAPGTDDLATTIALLRAASRGDHGAMHDLVKGLDDSDDLRGIVIFATMIGGLAMRRSTDDADEVLDDLAALVRGEST